MPLTWQPCWSAMASLSQVRGLHKTGHKSSTPSGSVPPCMDGCPEQPGGHPSTSGRQGCTSWVRRQGCCSPWRGRQAVILQTWPP